MANTKTSALTALTAPATGDGVPIVDDYGGSPELKVITLLNMLKVINGLTEETAPARSADYVAIYNASASAARKTLVGSLGAIELTGGFTASNPADSTTYYFGGLTHISLGTSAAASRIYIPRAGNITRADIYMPVGGTGTAETSTLYLRKNNTTDTTLSSSVAWNANPYHEVVTGLTIAVSAGDYVEFKLAAASMATNATSVYGVCKLLLE